MKYMSTMVLIALGALAYFFFVKKSVKGVTKGNSHAVKSSKARMVYPKITPIKQSVLVSAADNAPYYFSTQAPMKPLQLFETP